MDDAASRRAMQRIAHEILECNGGVTNLVLIGIRTRGAHLADRIGTVIKRVEGASVPTWYLDISFYRDDLRGALSAPVVQKTEILFDVAGKTVVLVDRDGYLDGQLVDDNTMTFCYRQAGGSFGGSVVSCSELKRTP